MAKSASTSVMEASGKLKPGNYIFQLINKVDPLVKDSKENPVPPYPPKKELPGKIPVFDEATESVRLVRVVPGATSIFVDDQMEKKIDEKRADENAWCPQFIYGTLMLTSPQDNQKIQRMLLDDRYDGKKIKSEAGKASWFTMIDENGNAVKTLDQMRAVREAETMAWNAVEKDFDAIEGHAKYMGVRYLDGSRRRTQDEITTDYINAARANPALFKKSISSPVVQIRAAIQTAIDAGIIDLGNIRGEACWRESKEHICKIDLKQDPVESLLEFASSGKDGSQFVATVKELIKK